MNVPQIAHQFAEQALEEFRNAAFGGIVSLTLVLVGISSAQTPPDTIRLTVAGAESKFLTANLQLLAARLGVEGSEAAVLQAGLWGNPNLAIEQNIYNPQTRRYFDFTRDGNSEVQVQQLLLLAGKRGNQVRVAKENAALTQDSFFDLLRSLKLQMRTDLYDLYYLRRTVSFYDESLAALTKTLAAANHMYESRTLLLSELLRLKSLDFTLSNERLALATQMEGIQQDLRILLGDTIVQAHVYVPEIDTVRDGLEHVSLDSAMSMASRFRPDLRVAETTVALDDANLSLQKSLAVPDVTVAGRWSRAGSYIPEYFGLSVAIDLPLFNRNQGGILMAERTLSADRLNLQSARLRVQKDVTLAYRKASDADRLLRSLDKTFTSQYATLVEGMISNYQKRYISVIEFTDFFESYRTSMLQMYQLQNSRLDAIEALNYAAGTDVVKP